PLRLLSMADQSATKLLPSIATSPLPPPPPSPAPLIKTPATTNTKTVDLPKIQLQRFEMDTRKRRNPSTQALKQQISVSNQPQSPILVTKSHAIMILPIATFIDLYDKRPSEEKTAVLEKINNFFKFYLQYRTNRIKQEMETIHSLQTISSSLSDRLKTFTALLNISIQIEPCQSISSVTFQGIDDLNRTIQRHVLTQKSIFPNVDRILPILWAEANEYVESLADILPAPYILWENFTDRVIGKHGLSHLINDITMSLYDEGKILVLNEVGTQDRVVFLRPSWLVDLLYGLFRHDMTTTYLDYDKNEIFSLSNIPESTFQGYKKEFLQFGLLHFDLLRSLWFGLLHKKEHLNHLWLAMMRFLLIAYPKISKAQLKHLLHIQTPDPCSKGEKKIERFIEVKQNPDVREEIKFDYAIVPYYLPFINQNEQQDEIKNFSNTLKNVIIIRYTSQSLPLGFFHRFSVSAIFRLSIIYKKHYNNFILGAHEEKDVRFLLETDHRTYFECRCGTSVVEQPLEEIWNLLMSILNHVEAMLTTIAPGNEFNRSVQCPNCKEFSFMGEWTTPKELQCSKMKPCILCGQNVDTARLVQPNESKRRSEELLRRIRERHAKSPNKGSDDVPPPASTATHLLVSPV
ncbi:unnamed protein product, partial [Rotaria magnacalcarata]